MRAITAAMLVVMSGCMLPPPPGFGGSPGGDTGELKVGTAEQYQYCTITEDFGFGSKNVEGEWQDYQSTFDVLSLQDGKANLRSISADGKVTLVASGTYSVDGTNVKLEWADGKSETVDAYVEDIPGCEMLTPREVTGEAPRLSEEMYFERVTCDWSRAEQPAGNVDEQVR